jgi:beta-N-acetylhexosaminidase
MSLREFRRHIGRLAIAGFSGHTVPGDFRELIATFDLGGTIYFARNAESPEQLAELSREIGGLALDWPLWTSVDQEGGRVARFKSPFTTWPPAATLGRSPTDDLTARFGRALAAELRAVGVNLDFAPVLDVLTNATNPAIGDRALASSPEDVARLGAVLIQALQEGGVAACGKHFPGHGDTSVDSHEDVPILEHDRRRLDAVELVPFRRAIASGVAAIMTAHVLVPPLDEDRVATLSPIVVTDLLKRSLGFAGVVMSDDLGMKAVSRTLPLPEAAVAAIRAGCDVVLLCNSTVEEQFAALEALIRATESGVLPQSRVDDAMRRQEAVKQRFLVDAAIAPVGLEVVGCTAHQVIASEMASWL